MIRSLLLLTLVLLGCQSSERDISTDDTVGYQIVLDKKRIERLGMAVSEITSALEQFYAGHPNAAVEEVSNLKLQQSDGQLIPLANIASISIVPIDEMEYGFQPADARSKPLPIRFSE